MLEYVKSRHPRMHSGKNDPPRKENLQTTCHFLNNSYISHIGLQSLCVSSIFGLSQALRKGGSKPMYFYILIDFFWPPGSSSTRLILIYKRADILRKHLEGSNIDLTGQFVTAQDHFNGNAADRDVCRELSDNVSLHFNDAATCSLLHE